MFEDLKEKEDIHSRVLQDAFLDGDMDVMKAEVMKIQLARFMYTLMPCAGGSPKINPKEIKEYYQKAHKFFEEKAKYFVKTDDRKRAVYYQDGLQLMKKWYDVYGWLNHVESDIDPMDEIRMDEIRMVGIKSMKPKKQKEISDILYARQNEWYYDGYNSKDTAIVFDDKNKDVGVIDIKPSSPCMDPIEEYKKTGIITSCYVINPNPSETNFYEAIKQRQSDHNKVKARITKEHVLTLDEHLGL